MFQRKTKIIRRKRVLHFGLEYLIRFGKKLFFQTLRLSLKLINGLSLLKQKLQRKQRPNLDGAK